MSVGFNPYENAKEGLIRVLLLSCKFYSLFFDLETIFLSFLICLFKFLNLYAFLELIYLILDSLLRLFYAWKVVR